MSDPWIKLYLSDRRSEQEPKEAGNDSKPA
jgi:hypothetical protein